MAQSPKSESVEDVLAAYVNALGGVAAIDQVTSREIHGSTSLLGHVTYYWQKPDKVLRVSRHEKIGYDGSNGWIAPGRNKLKKLSRFAQTPLEIDANPLRYARLKDLYSDLAVGKPETIDERPMRLIVAPNNIGATRFYFDSETHLLRRIEETGETSAYFKITVDFLDYKPVNALQFPFRIVHSTTERGGKEEDFRIGKVTDNVPLNPAAFSNPRIDSAVERK